jgi:hydrogenase-4 component B
MIVPLLLAAAVLAALSGAPGLLLRRGARAAQRVATLATVAASGLGLCGAAAALVASAAPRLAEPAWTLAGMPVGVRVDGLAAVFLIPIFLVSGLGAVYGEAYWAETDHPDSGRKLRFFYGLMTGAMVLVTLARGAALFLISWEVMALSAFFLIVTDGRERATREAGWIYLAATHVATLALLGLFAVVQRASGALALDPVPAGIAAAPAGSAVFLLALLGFGLKAGVLPLHVWLPGAHSAAPSHVSALMSGVMIKVGIYGLVRVLSLFPDPPAWWGESLLGVGILTGILGVAFALGQHDLKRLLAYHSVENIGIIVLGLGLATAGRSAGRPEWVTLGLGGALLHVVNHALFKSLLFFGAGCVAHSTGTREMDRLGGLLTAMPRTGALFLVGAVAICGLPPLNGFVSEWLLYLGLFEPLRAPAAGSWFWVSFLAAGLALIGALALACFVKAFGAVFLGLPRSERAAGAREVGWPMLAPMAVLAAACLAVGLWPAAVAPALQRAVAAAAPTGDAGLPALTALAALGPLSTMSLALLAALGLVGLVLGRRLRSTRRAAVTWDCGYAAPSPRQQYTSSSFAQLLVGFFRWALVPSEESTRLGAAFPRAARFHSSVPDTILDRLLLPGLRSAARFTLYARYLQQGRVQVYLLYVVLTLLLLLATV